MTIAVSGDSITFNDLSVQNTAATGFGFKNRIINGDMRIDQRNGGASSTANNVFTVDRWGYQATQSSKGTWQQNAGSVTPPIGFINYLGFTSSSAFSVAAGDYFSFYQGIEGLNVSDLGWGTANAQTITLSFWVRSSLTGTHGGAIRNANGTYAYPFTYTISSANTWEQKTIIVVGPITGTFVTTNSCSFYIYINLGCGTTFSGTAGAWSANNYLSATGATSVVGTSGATFYITGVQLEKGSTATAFDYRDYGRELRLCQRYSELISMLFTTGGQTFYGYYKVTKRANATHTYVSGIATGSVGAVDVNTAFQASYSGIAGGVVYLASAEL